MLEHPEKNIKPKNISESVYKVDPELVLTDELTKKFGNRFLEYRKLYNELQKSEKPDHINLGYPLTVNLELVNRCNLECVMCYQGYRNDANLSKFSDETLDKMFIDFKKNQLSALMLSVSEPLLFKNIEKILIKAKEAQIMDVFLFTNGALLNDEKANMILNNHVTRLFISLDAATQKSYNEVRVPVAKRLLKENRLSFVEDNIVKFIKKRDEQKSKLPLVRVSFVILDKNKHEIKEFKDKWTNIVDSIDFQIERPVELFESVKDNDFSSQKINDDKSYDCSKPWSELCIYADGSVSPCCAFIGRKIPLANVNEYSVKEIWDNQNMKKVREGIENNSPVKACDLCLKSEKIIAQKGKSELSN